MAHIDMGQGPGISRASRLIEHTAVTALVASVALAGVFIADVCAGGRRDLAFVQVPVDSCRVVGEDIGNTILSGRYLEGMRVVVAESGGSSVRPEVVTEGFLCATDPAFNRDGTRLLFCGKRSAQEHLQIWEISPDSAEPQQVFRCDADCIRPLYLPNGHIVFASLLSEEYEEHGGQYSFSLYEWVPGSEEPTRLTFNPSSEFDPALLEDGRLVFSSWQHVGNHYWPRGNMALMLTNWDGTGLFPLTGNHRDPWLKRGARQLTGDLIAFIQADSCAEFGDGELVTTNLNDSFAAYKTVIAPDKYRVSDVTATPDGNILIAAQPADDSARSFGLYVSDGNRVRMFYDDPDQHELNPVVCQPERRPDNRFSTVVPGTPHGYLLVLNAFESDRVDSARLNNQSVGTVRVIEGIALRDEGGRRPRFLSVPGREDEPMVNTSSATGYIPSRILGEVPVASDGSLYLKVPADRPLRLQLVDRQGFTIMNERSWFWVRPNERRVCIGCHENRELAPDNSTPQAARHVPTDLTNPDGWQTLTYRQDIQPIITSSCAVTECHLPPRPTAGMSLASNELCGEKDAVLARQFGPPYANLLERQDGKPYDVGGRRIHPGDSRQSPLLWMLYGLILGPQYEPAPFERPINESHPGPILPGEYLATIRRWIDLGAIYDHPKEITSWPFANLPSITGATRKSRGVTR